VRFAFTEDQLAFRDAVRALLQKECPPEIVRAAWTNETGRTSRAWRSLGEMGVLGALVPEAQGGLGLSELDVVLLAEETGRVALPEPFVEHALVGAPLLATAEAAAGVTTVTAGDPLVPYADTSAMLVQLGRESFVAGREDVTLEPHRSVDHSRRLFGVEAAAPVRLEATEVSTAYWRGNLGFSAQLVGLGNHLLDTTTDYVVARHQFGAPIGSFQAIKHKLADVRIALEFAAPLVYRSAYSLATRDPGARTHVAMAKAAAADAATLAARHALQCHGALGYSFEYDLHLWIKRVWALSATWGDATWHREYVARAILDS
jgi:alkylation response protein AidB-like acyl-CoA dehydrogenase